LILGVVASGEEGEVFAVGAPAWVRRGDALGGEGDGIAAMGGDHPEALLVLVVLEDTGSNGISDPLAIGA